MGTQAVPALICLLLAGAARAEPFVREDWVYSVEPTHLEHFGINHWGLTSFALPYRALQRGKHAWEAKHDNWRFESRAGKIGGGAMRFGSTVIDMALYSGPQNFDHVLAHDSRAREFSKDYPATSRHMSRRFTQVLPAWLGGKELAFGEKTQSNRGAPDTRTLENSTIWEMRNQFVYEAAKTVMARDAVNAVELENLIFHRLSLLQTQWEGVDQVCASAYRAQGQTPAQCLAGSGSARDFSNYLMDLNTGRYGVSSVDAYKLRIGDLQRANQVQFADPVFLVALYRYGADYLVNGKNTSRLPMIPLGSTGLSYLPGLRVDLSPFGVEYINDNYFRYRGTIVNLFWTRGDDKYERRLGAGFDAVNIPLIGSVTGGVFGQLYKQPLMSRIEDLSALTPAEVGRQHNVYNVGASLRIPLMEFGADRKDPKQLLLTLKAGRKNTGWIPGEYIKGATYLETGVGLRL